MWYMHSSCVWGWFVGMHSCPMQEWRRQRAPERRCQVGSTAQSQLWVGVTTGASQPCKADQPGQGWQGLPQLHSEGCLSYTQVNIVLPLI